MAEPAPARDGGTADMIDAVMGDIESAMPVVRGTTHNTTYAYAVCVDKPVNSNSPVAMQSIPTPTVRCAPNRALSRGVSGATTSMIIAMGMSLNAADSAL